MNHSKGLKHKENRRNNKYIHSYCNIKCTFFVLLVMITFRIFKTKIGEVVLFSYIKFKNENLFLIYVKDFRPYSHSGG